MKYGISIVLALLIPLICSQRPNSNRRIQQVGTPTRNSVSTSNSRATQLAEGGGNLAPRGCVCIPKNQICNLSGEIPPHSDKVTKKRNLIDMRIVNRNPKRICAIGKKQCCFVGNREPESTGGTTGGQSGALKGCGVTTNLIAVPVKGSETQFGEYPWMTAILKNSSDFVSGGFIASPDTIVTAAHTVDDPILYKVHVGDWDLSDPNEVPQYPHQEIPVAKVILHPQFNASTLHNDVAILKLQRPIRYSDHINAVCLPERRQTFAGVRCYLSAWGINKHKQRKHIMEKVELPVVDDYECEIRLRKTRLGPNFKLDTQSFVCAGGEKGKDGCDGDGGSPLVCKEGSRWTVVGLVAWGIGCAEQHIPGVYVNLAAFSDFINRYI